MEFSTALRWIRNFFTRITLRDGNRSGATMALLSCRRRQFKSGQQLCLTIAKATLRAAAPITAASNVTVNSRLVMAVDSTCQLRKHALHTPRSTIPIPTAG
jgi:hypothetical protein